MALESFQGSTSHFCRVKRGVVLKYPVQIWSESSSHKLLTDKIANNFSVERQIFHLLGSHPRIVLYLGWHDAPGDPRGLLLVESSYGNLQRYLDENYETTSSSLRRKWCIQVVESIAYIHRHDVIHSDLRPENFLVHATTPTSLDLWLCDFGGSTCEKLGLDGGHLPDSGFYDPKSEPVSTAQTDIFSVASVIYTILTGHWPYRGPGPFRTGEEMEEYRQRVDHLFEQGQFPDVDGLFAGKVIMKCWRNEYANADDVLQEFRSDMMRETSDVQSWFVI
ncbi:putative serine/threonine-protein kinase gdt2 [Tolypocladium ophioglossoides CBS 100239]|uniref:EKC/KEOPS complex subunit BUD32 n=1 Tax=Tolypocladium ophioglossoides (strain CBS 100239) TaxID=1163406 RepID=A0A0L0MX96_TOLOC|nr:putative serine/threonine-protein kinase gdt2 [Tolypocladium ophioglossoides CBS 100239]